MARSDTHPFLAPGPIAIAHRGGADDAPENSLPAFEAAIRLGYRYLETDVHATRDDEVVAFHDARLDRVTDRAGAIADLELAAVQQADAGYWFSPDGGSSFPFRGRGITVPRLEDLLLRWPDARINIDPKSNGAVPALVRLIDRLRAWDRVCIGAFSDARLRRIRASAQQTACTSMGPGALALARVSAIAGRVVRAGADCVQVPIKRKGVPIVTPRFVRACHRAHLHVQVWTINDEPTMQWLLDLGVDGIMTDRPKLLYEVFERRGLPLAGGA